MLKHTAILALSLSLWVGVPAAVRAETASAPALGEALVVTPSVAEPSDKPVPRTPIIQLDPLTSAAATPADTAMPPAHPALANPAPAQPEPAAKPAAPAVQPAVAKPATTATQPAKPAVAAAPAKPATPPAAAAAPVQAGAKITVAKKMPAANVRALMDEAAENRLSSRKIDLVRSIPLEISAYNQDGSIPANFHTADQVISVLDTKRNLLVHMETLRRAYSDLGPAERDALLVRLFERYRALNDDAVRFFDHGYAQFVFNDNKTGLFFMRKANEALKDQFSSLAYAIAQVEADINIENASPAEMNARKLDVTFLMKDAVKRDAHAHKPGFWPTYVRVLEQLRPMAAFSDFTTQDFSLLYVPYGNSVFPDAAPQYGATSTANAFLAMEGQSCAAYEPFLKEPGDTLFNERLVDFQGSGHPFRVRYFNTGQPNNYKVAVFDDGQQTLANFTTPVAPYIVEDIDADGKFEFVVRQFAYEPLEPIKVYRLNGCRFELDQDIAGNFK